jgi:hypothetical protein
MAGVPVVFHVVVGTDDGRVGDPEVGLPEFFVKPRPFRAGALPRFVGVQIPDVERGLVAVRLRVGGGRRHFLEESSCFVV